MFFGYNHNNLYKWNLTINFFFKFYLLQGLTLAPNLARSFTHILYVSSNCLDYSTLKTLNVASNNENAWKNSFVSATTFSTTTE